MSKTQTGARSPLRLDGRSLTVGDVVDVAREGVGCSLAGKAVEKIEASRRLKEELIEQEIPIYGVTTGFGDSADRQISPQKAARLQRNMVRFLGSGTGPLASEEVVRATLLLRANCLSRGNSGVRTELVERLLYHLNQGILPAIPERGSCGASGDLVPLSYVGAALLGEEDVLYEGSLRDSAGVLREHGLQPLKLEPKEGLAITNGTSFLTAFAALAAWDAAQLAPVAEVCTAMASEALLGNKGHFNAFIHEQKPHAGKKESARNIRGLLADSGLSQDGEKVLSEAALDGRSYQQLERQVQDKYSVRCAPDVVGCLRDTVEWALRWVEVEINSSDDNPLFDAEGWRLHSGGNFYGGHMAQAMDSLKVAVANLCDLLDRQLELVVDEKFNNGLTPNLIPYFEDDDPEAGLHHGFKGMQLCCSAMTAEALNRSNPASVFSRSTEAHNQDKVSMGTIAARDARAVVELAQNVAAIHLISLCQALDLRGSGSMSPKTHAAYRLVRDLVPFLEGDRRMGKDIERVVDLIRSGALEKVVLAEMSINEEAWRQ